MKLSILVCSVLNRHDTFLPKISKQLQDQYQALSDDDKKQVEIMILSDNKKMMLGHKRNSMVSLAQGKYVQFVDDDDRIADDFIKTLLDATKTDADVIVFKAEVSINGEPPKICTYSKDFIRDHNTDNEYRRIPNHICCVKRKLAERVTFPNVLYGEDSGYSKLLLRYLKDEHKIDKVLYYYDFNNDTTETQMHLKNKPVKHDTPPIVDVIILSKATTGVERRMTRHAVESCINGANGLSVNVIVLEQGRGVYKGAKVIDKSAEEFHYNRFANFGAKQGSADWIMIANNDIEFTDGWLHSLLAAEYPIVSPHEPTDTRQLNMEENERGYENGRHFSGWCFMIARKLWEDIGGFDESVWWWCSDDVVIEQLKKIDTMPMLVNKSVVRHNKSVTLRKQSQPQKEHLTWGSLDAYIKKYGSHKLQTNPQYIKWKETHGQTT